MGKSASEVRADIEDTQSKMSETIDAIADKASPRRIVDRRRRAVANGWRSVRERVMGPAESATGAAGDRARGMSDSARDTAGSVAEAARQVPDTVISQTQGNPMAVRLVAFGAGLLAATLISSLILDLLAVLAMTAWVGAGAGRSKEKSAGSGRRRAIGSSSADGLTRHSAPSPTAARSGPPRRASSADRG